MTAAIARPLTQNDQATQVSDPLHLGLTVDMIMTPRDLIMDCAPDDPVAMVVSRNTERYSYIPVRSDDRYVGLLTAEPWFDRAPPDGTVADHFRPMSEDLLIGADASILNFVCGADHHPCKLVVSRHRIEGMVCRSDLQKLPVRAALFAVITGFEMEMMNLIRAHFPDDAWKAHLTPGRLKKVNDQIGKSKKADGYVDALLFAQFCDKRDIILEGIAAASNAGLTEDHFKTFETLRNALAHANDYADTPDEQCKTSSTIRHMLEVKHIMSEIILQ